MSHFQPILAAYAKNLGLTIKSKHWFMGFSLFKSKCLKLELIVYMYNIDPDNEQKIN